MAVHTGRANGAGSGAEGALLLLLPVPHQPRVQCPHVRPLQCITPITSGWDRTLPTFLSPYRLALGAGPVGGGIASELASASLPIDGPGTSSNHITHEQTYSANRQNSHLLRCNLQARLRLLLLLVRMQISLHAVILGILQN